MDATKTYNGEFKAICNKIIVDNLLFKLSLILNAILKNKRLIRKIQRAVQKITLPK